MAAPRLIVVSNRTAAGNVERAGGLAVALRDVLGPDDLWVGWSGRIFDYPSRTPRRSTEHGINFALIDLAKPEFDGYYLGHSNSALWPAVHNRLDLVNFDTKHFRAYAGVNRKFAQLIAEEASPDDLVWIHDFHLFLTARYLRELGVTSRLGLFLHTPFPPAEVFRAVPGHEDIGNSLAAFDVIGTQTRTDLRNLARYLAEDHGAEPMPDAKSDHTYRIGKHTLRLLHCPIGMDVAGFSDLPTTKPARKAVKRIDRLVGKKRDFVIGVDRMDYSKGLPERFEGMGLVFDQYPETHGKLCFLQIAPPSRSDVQEYQDLRERLDRLSGRINGDHGDLDWLPIRYLAKGYPREELAGLFRYAKVGLVTPLQDGMNLVAKEYIAAQDPEDPGVLVLSQFAGAAEQMSEALLVNPHDTQAIAHAVIRALRMPLAERRRRWQTLYEGLEAQDISWWRDRFLKALKA